MDLPTVEEVLGKLEEANIGTPVPSLRSRSALPEYEKKPIEEKEAVLTN